MLLLLILLRIWYIIPKVYKIEENFNVYDYSYHSNDIRNLDFNITITKFKQILSDNQFKVELEIGDRTYRYDSRNFDIGYERDITFKSPVFNFGIMLTNDDFSEFAVIFDEKYHHYDNSEKLEYIVFSRNNAIDPRDLLEKLMAENGYNK